MVFPLTLSVSLPISFFLAIYLSKKCRKRTLTIWLIALPFLTTAVAILATSFMWIPDLLVVLGLRPNTAPLDFDFTGAMVRFVVLIDIPGTLIANSLLTAGLGLYWHFKRKREQKK